MQPGSPLAHRGFTLPALLLMVMLVSLAAATTGPLWSHTERRDRERELIKIGSLYADALTAYRQASPGTTRQFPERLEELLLDPRFVGYRRHLRRLYPDPLQPSAPWGLVRDEQGRIAGVHSLSEQAPIAHAPALPSRQKLQPAGRYRDWKFMGETP
ncbi:type II secretion system protein [Pseudorhodoferax sp.]|uniref:type II secretion system protein n=1 Tax=Pseudorhodoferax sp. TaxID=1993553 RepID=UPI002DD68C84|nr:type II secretion system protein [Pseudorhodoferax sp.]